MSHGMQEGISFTTQHGALSLGIETTDLLAFRTRCIFCLLRPAFLFSVVAGSAFVWGLPPNSFLNRAREYITTNTNIHVNIF